MWPDLKDKWLKKRKLPFLWSSYGSLSLFLCHTLDWSSQAHLNSRGKWEIDSIAWWKSGSVLKKTCRARNDAVPIFGKSTTIHISHMQNTLIPSHNGSRPELLRDYEVAIILWNYIYIKIKSHQIWSIVLDVWKVNTLKKANTWMKHVGTCQCAISILSKWGLYE